MPGQHATGEDGGSVGLLEAVAIEVGLIIGGALFGLVGTGVDVAGAGVVVSFATAILLAAIALVPTAMLGATFPTTCGHYRYPAQFVSGPVAFVAAWGLGVSMFTGGIPLYARTAGEFLESVIPVAPRLSGLALLTVFFLVNLLGIRPAARAQLVMFLGIVAALGAFVLFGLPSVDAGNLTPMFSGNVLGILIGTGILYFASLGANFVIDIGGDLRDATVTIPKSFLVSLPLVFLIYISVAVVAVGTMGVDAMANETLVVPAERILSPAFQTLFVVAGAVFAIATSLNAAYILIPRYAEALADAGIFPRIAGETNERFGTAHWALLGTYLLGVVTLFAPIPFEDMGALLGLGGAFVVAVVMLAAIAVIRKSPPNFDPAGFPIPTRLVLGFAVLAVPLNLLLIVLLATQALTLFLSWLLALVIGLGYYEYRMVVHGSPEAATGDPL